MFTLFYSMTAVALLLLTSVLHPAFVVASGADSSQSERVYREGADGEGALTQKMIEDCMTLKGTIDDTYSAITEIQGQNKALGEDAKELGTLLDQVEEQKGLDPNDSQELTAYSATVEQYNAKVAEGEKLINMIKEKKEEYDKLTSRFDRECKGQLYYEDDYDAAVKKTGNTL